MLPAGVCRRGGAVLMPPGRCVGLRPGVGRVFRCAPALCSGSGFLRCVRRSAVGEAWPPRLRFRPSPRALPAVRTQRRPRARNRPAMRQRTAPAERRRWQAVRPCACAVALPEACRRGGAVLMPPGRCVGLCPGVGRAPALCSGSGFRRCMRRSAIGEAWPPRLRFRPSPRALSAVRTQRRPRARNRPAMRQRTAPTKRTRWHEAGGLCLCPAGRCRRAVPRSCLRAAVWACVRAWAVPLGDCRALWP